MKLMDYISGNRRGKQAQQIERAAMEDPLLADALEGYENTAGNHSEAIERLQAHVARHVAGEKKSGPRSKRLLMMSIGVAASVLLAVVLLRIARPDRDMATEERVLALAEITETTDTTSPSEQSQQELAKEAQAEESGKISDIKCFIPPTVSADQEVVEEMVAQTDMLHSVPPGESAKQEISDDTQVSDEMYVTLPFNANEKKMAASSVMAQKEASVLADQMPRFQDGNTASFRAWVQDRLQHPADTTGNRTYGKVVVEFFIERDGSLSHIKILQSSDRSLSKEVIRVLNSSPKWTPGMQGGEPTRMKQTLSLDFTNQTTK